MKVCISVPGRFHGFDLALELQKRDCLHCLVTSYPKFKAKESGIEERLVRTVLSKELIVRGYYKLFKRYPNWFWLNEWFDKMASRKLPMDGDIYILWAGFALHSIRRIRRKNPNAKIILERGSAHIEEQQRLLSLVGQSQTVLREVVEKEMKEYKESDFISVPGKFVASTFIEKNVSKEKIVVNAYGVDLKLFTEHRKKNDSDIFTVGYVGVISKQKNVEGIINSVRNLIEQGFKIKLVIAGGIDTNSYPLNYLKQFNFVSYLGNIQQNQLPAIYGQMDVFVLNSVQDGFGMVLLQAMSMQVPSIATYNSGGVDIIANNENGYLIPILDDRSLTESIKLLIDNPEKRKRMGERARKTVSGEFGWTDYGDRYTRFLEGVNSDI